MFKTFSASSQMSFQVWSSFDEFATQWKTIGLEERIDIGDLANVTIIMYSIRVFPNTPPRKLPNHRSAYEVKIVHENICLDNVLHCCNVLHTNTSKVCTICATNFFEEQIEWFESFLLESPISMQMQRNSSKKIEIVIVRLLDILLRCWTLDELIFQ